MNSQVRKPLRAGIATARWPAELGVALKLRIPTGPVTFAIYGQQVACPFFRGGQPTLQELNVNTTLEL